MSGIGGRLDRRAIGVDGLDGRHERSARHPTLGLQRRHAALRWQAARDPGADRTYTGVFAALRWGLPFQAVRF